MASLCCTTGSVGSPAEERILAFQVQDVVQRRILHRLEQYG